MYMGAFIFIPENVTGSVSDAQQILKENVVLPIM
jgi:hypothetical protein